MTNCRLLTADAQKIPSKSDVRQQERQRNRLNKLDQFSPIVNVQHNMWGGAGGGGRGGGTKIKNKLSLHFITGCEIILKMKMPGHG